MRSHRIAFYCASLAVATLPATAAHADNSPLGVWIDHTGRGAVAITDCKGKLCGRVAWVKDAKNSAECGKEIIGNVEPVGKNHWDNGWIYDPDRGSKYDVELTALDNDKLRVKGYAGTKWLSETYIWKRAPADLKTCAPGEASHTTPPEATAKADAPPPPPPPPTSDKKAAQLDATKSDADAGKSSTAKPDATAAPKAKAPPNADEENSNTADTAGDASQGGKGEAKKVIARIMEELESGDGPVKLKRTGKTCRLNVPYVDTVVSFRCDKDQDSD